VKRNSGSVLLLTLVFLIIGSLLIGGFVVYKKYFVWNTFVEPHKYFQLNFPRNLSVDNNLTFTAADSGTISLRGEDVPIIIYYVFKSSNCPDLSDTFSLRRDLGPLCFYSSKQKVASEIVSSVKLLRADQSPVQTQLKTYNTQFFVFTVPVEWTVITNPSDNENYPVPPAEKIFINPPGIKISAHKDDYSIVKNYTEKGLHSKTTTADSREKFTIDEQGKQTIIIEGRFPITYYKIEINPPPGYYIPKKTLDEFLSSLAFEDKGYLDPKWYWPKYENDKLGIFFNYPPEFKKPIVTSASRTSTKISLASTASASFKVEFLILTDEQNPWLVGFLNDYLKDQPKFIRNNHENLRIGQEDAQLYQEVEKYVALVVHKNLKIKILKYPSTNDFQDNFREILKSVRFFQ